MALSVPTVRVNNDVIEIVPNTYKFKRGAGERNVRAGSSGGGNSSSVATENAETQFSTIKFEIYPTAENLLLYPKWQANFDNNTVDHFQLSGNIAESFKNVVMTNDPEVEAGADTTIKIEMAGDKLPG